ncbi:hypothetical protein BDV95DRAFT_601494 [Massariosphaeria phaeospora]|uniref:Uncharacterized protein n=1 Tax=Massariosphaeria phaeospora TaxID=100035 RepID=A0A7C8MGN7_9PLEO|nr:hypothetical protein BDV95DRAFT_601494 [Massariosphaeria phaeospora]
MDIPWLDKGIFPTIHPAENETLLKNLSDGKHRFEWKQVLNYTAVSQFVVPFEAFTKQNESRTQGSILIVCAVDARWLSTAISTQPRVSARIETNVTDLSIFDKDKLRASSTKRANEGLSLDLGIAPDRIMLPEKWLNSLTAAHDSVNNTRYSGMDKILAALTVQSPRSNHTHFSPKSHSSIVPVDSDEFQDYLYQVTTLLSTLVGASIADGLARYTLLRWSPVLEVSGVDSQSNEYLPLSSTGRRLTSDEVWSQSSKKSAFWVEFHETRYGYGFGISPRTSGTSLKIAITVLGTYCLIVLSHCLMILVKRWRKKYVRNESWNHLYGLIALAATSDRSRYLQGSGTGIKETNMYTLLVKIRESLDGGVTLVFGRKGDEDSLNKVVRGQKHD